MLTTDDGTSNPYKVRSADGFENDCWILLTSLVPADEAAAVRPAPHPHPMDPMTHVSERSAHCGLIHPRYGDGLVGVRVQTTVTVLPGLGGTLPLSGRGRNRVCPTRAAMAEFCPSLTGGVAQDSQNWSDPPRTGHCGPPPERRRIGRPTQGRAAGHSHHRRRELEPVPRAHRRRRGARLLVPPARPCRGRGRHGKSAYDLCSVLCCISICKNLACT